MRRGNRFDKRFSLILVSHAGRPARHLALSRLVLVGMLVFIAVLVSGGGGVFWHLSSQEGLFGQRVALEAKIQSQAKEISAYQAQIQAFAGRIDQISARLGELDGLEHELRTLANLETSNDQQGVYSVGGLEPADSSSSADLVRDHRRLIRSMHARTRVLDEAVEQQRLDFEKLLGALGRQQDLRAATPSIRPIDGGWISSAFGYRISPFTGRRVIHQGLDIASHPGRPIFATADGKVTFSGKNGKMGKTIVINHGHGMVTYYGHCQKLLKKKGAEVKRGEVIAKVGNTGRSTGPHLHYEVRLNGVAVNPQKYLIN